MGKQQQKKKAQEKSDSEVPHTESLTLEQLAELKHEAEPRTVSFCDASRRLCFGGWTSKSHVYNCSSTNNTFEEIAVLDHNENRTMFGCAFRTSNELFTTHSEGEILVWDLSSLPDNSNINSSNNESKKKKPVVGLVVEEEEQEKEEKGKEENEEGEEEEQKESEVPKIKPIHRIKVAENSEIRTIKFSPDRKRFAVCYEGDEVDSDDDEETTTDGGVMVFDALDVGKKLGSCKMSHAPKGLTWGSFPSSSTSNNNNNNNNNHDDSPLLFICGLFNGIDVRLSNSPDLKLLNEGEQGSLTQLKYTTSHDPWWMCYSPERDLFGIPRASEGEAIVATVFSRQTQKPVYLCKRSESASSPTCNACDFGCRGNYLITGGSKVEIFSLQGTSSSSSTPQTVTPIWTSHDMSGCWTLSLSRGEKLLAAGCYGTKSITVFSGFADFVFKRRNIVLKLRFLPNKDQRLFEIYTVCFLVSSYL